MISAWITAINDTLWSLFLPFLILLGLYVNSLMFTTRNTISQPDSSTWHFSKIKAALSISLASKTGTGAIIGVLAAMWLNSIQCTGGEGVVLWVLIGMLVMVPITYSEVLFTQVEKRSPRDFIRHHLNTRLSQIYVLGLVTLYAFGFVGFQFTGVQTVAHLFADHYLNYHFTHLNALAGVVIPIIIVAALIIFSKSHQLFVNTLSSMIFTLVISYFLFFLVFLILTPHFWTEYLVAIYQDFLRPGSLESGLPAGMIIGFQRIIQISETSLGTAALSSSDRNNSPRREAMIQTTSTIISIFVAVVITSYVFSYGHHNVAEVAMVGDGLGRIKGFLLTAYAVTGFPGLFLVASFFVISGFTTILGSFHYVNTSVNLGLNARITVYLLLISCSGILSVANFDVIFEASNLLMFIVASINLVALACFVSKKTNYSILRPKVNFQ